MREQAVVIAQGGRIAYNRAPAGGRFALQTLVFECALASATSYLVDEETPLWGFLLPGDSGSGSDRG